MHLSRIVVKNFRSLRHVDVNVKEKTSCIIGENNTGKSNLIQALRLCLDVTLSSSYRNLMKDDIHTDVDQNAPFQVLIGVEFTGFEGQDYEEALLHGTQIAEGRARIFFRFRPKKSVREALALEEIEGNSLKISDYGWELSGGGNPEMDLAAIEWDTEADEIGARSVYLQHLQSFLIVYLHALRDVESDLQQLRRSPLALLIESCNISEDEQEELISAIQTANDSIEESETIQAISAAIDGSFKSVTGPAFSMDIGLGLASPSFQSIIRNLNVLLSNTAVNRFDPKRNGLGFNNILYIAILIEYFKKRASNGRSAGELILIEEPEAHLHPQLQITLMESLMALPFQSIVTTHSPQITSKSPLNSFILLTNQEANHPYVAALANNPSFVDGDIPDLERYLDATKSSLLFARKVMLVEGAAEALLIPPLVKQVMDIDLEKHGISIVAINGTHFGSFARLFNANCLPKKCAIVADADGPTEEGADDGDDIPAESDIAALESDFVKPFLGATTFERELVIDGNIAMLKETARTLGATRLIEHLENAELVGIDDDLKDRVLRTAKRFRKGRFSQVMARHINQTCALPGYIADAVNWLIEE